MECNGTTYVGVVEDDLGEIRYVYCDACRTIAVDAWDARRKRRSWGITYVDPKTLQPPSQAPPKERILNRLQWRLRRRKGPRDG